MKIDVSPAQPVTDFITIEENLEVKSEISDDANNEKDSEIRYKVVYVAYLRRHEHFNFLCQWHQA